MYSLYEAAFLVVLVGDTLLFLQCLEACVRCCIALMQGPDYEEQAPQAPLQRARRWPPRRAEGSSAC